MNTNTETKTKTASTKTKPTPAKAKVVPAKAKTAIKTKTKPAPKAKAKPALKTKVVPKKPVSKKYLSTYNSEIIKLKNKYKNIKMCCDDQNQLVNLIKDVEKIMEMKEIEPNLGKLYKQLDNKIENLQRKEMMINILRIFLDDDYYSTKEKKERMKKFIEEKTDIKLKDKCVNVGKLISSSYLVKFYEHKTNKKRIIKEKIITHYNLKSDNNFGYNISSILDEIKIFQKLKKEDFTSRLLDYYICEKNDDIVLYMEIEKKGEPLSKWLDEDNILTESHKKSIKDLLVKLHKLNIIYKSGFNTDGLLIDTTKKTKKFYISNFENSDTRNHLFSKAKKEDIENLDFVLKWSSPYSEIELKSLIIYDIGVKFIF